MAPHTSAMERPSSMLSELRGATASRHARLDRVSLEIRPTQVTRASYVAFLRGMLAIVRPLEEGLQAFPSFEEQVPNAPLRRRAYRLTSDLQSLGVAALPRLDAPNLPAIESMSQAFGCSYVLEGSSLGGAVLARTLGPKLQLSFSAGMSYWAAYGDQVGPMWTSFVAALELWAAGATESDRRAAVASACATFDAFITQTSARNAASTGCAP